MPNHETGNASDVDQRDAVPEMLRMLEATGLASRPGKVLYSGRQTLCPGKLYLLGHNPGGDPADEAETTRSDFSGLCDKRPDWNEYVDGAWRPRGRHCQSGAAPLQRRVAYMLAGLGLAVRNVCASNLIFVRSSRSVNDICHSQDFAELCWPIHEFILNIVQPQCIVTFGGEVVNFVSSRCRLSGPEESFRSGHGSWECRYSCVVLQGRKTALISLPHLSRYAINHHPEVIRWMRSKIEELG